MAEAATVRLEEPEDLGAIFARLRRHVPVVLLCMIGGLALAWALAVLVPNSYTASAKLDYSPQETAGSTTRPQSDLLRDAQIDAQVQTAESLPVAMRVVEKLDLESDPSFAEARSGGPDVPRGQALAAALLRDVAASRVGKTTLFEVSYTHPDPVRAARIANAFADAFLDNELARKIEQSNDIDGRLQERLNRLRGELEVADAQVAAFRVRNNLLSAPDSTAMQQEVSVLRTQLAAARAQAAEAVTRSSAGGLNTVVGGSAIGPGASALGSLRSQRAEIAGQVASLSSRVGPRHPSYQAAVDQLGAIDAQIAAEMATLSQTAQSESSALGSSAASLSASLAAAEARLAGAVGAGAELARLERQAQNAREVYLQLQAASVDQSANRALIRPDTRLLAPASVPLEPSSPNLLVALFMGLVLGLAGGLGVAYARVRWAHGVSTADDVEVLLGQRYLNSIPTPRSAIESPRTDDPVEAVALHPRSAYTEAFRNLATSLGFATRGAGGKVLGIASALPNEGKTTTAIALARVLAEDGASVVLLDADLRRRALSLRLAPQARQGLAEALGGTALLEHALVAQPTGVDVLPLTPGSSASLRLFQSREFADLLERLRRRYEYIVVDTAPLLAVADTRLLFSHFDASVLLTRWRETPVKAVKAALHQLESVGGAITGVALTMVDLKAQPQAASGDPSYYAASMKDYYLYG